MHKKGHKLKTSPLVKNPQFSSNLDDIQKELPTREAIILTKFHKECKKIVDFLHRQKFLACALFYASPFTFIFACPILAVSTCIGISKINFPGHMAL